MKRKHIIIYSCITGIIILLVFIGYISRVQKKVDYFKLNTVCFERDILPVFLKNCSVAGCHDQQSESGSYRYVDYNSIIRSVVPFRPEKSIVYKSLIGRGVSTMPPGQKLTENEILLIYVWIGQGAGNTVCSLSTIQNLPRPGIDESNNGFNN